MGIGRLMAEDVPTWVRSAAESTANTRMASGGLSRGGAADLMRSVLSTFRRGIPSNMDVWIDDEGSWLWVEYADDSHLQIHAGFLDVASDIDEWARFVTSEFSEYEVLWQVWGEEDSLALLAQHVGAQARSVVMSASVSSFVAPAGSSGAWLRPMGAGELMRFQVAAANELGVAQVASGESTSVDEARRKAFRSIENELRDGVASPGHRLYSLCHGGQTVGGTWFEIDGGVAKIRSVVLDSGARGQGHRRAALAALAATAHMEGARKIQTTVIPPSHPFVDVLKDMGMNVVSTTYVRMPDTTRTPALVH